MAPLSTSFRFSNRHHIFRHGGYVGHGPVVAHGRGKPCGAGEAGQGIFNALLATDPCKVCLYFRNAFQGIEITDLIFPIGICIVDHSSRSFHGSVSEKPSCRAIHSRSRRSFLTFAICPRLTPASLARSCIFHVLPGLFMSTRSTLDALGE